MPKTFTSSMIILIPKCPNPPNPSDFDDFWPISPCNFTSKIITKIVALRLAQLLPSLICISQSSFVKDRNITDNVLVVFELVHSINHKVRGSNLVIKLDMKKVFERVS